MKIKHISLLLNTKKKTGGRNKDGTIVVKHKGGGHKQKQRLVDHCRNLLNTTGTVIDIQRSPTRTANLALIVYPQGVLAYIIAPEMTKLGTKIIAAQRVNLTPGNTTPLKNILLGTLVHNIEPFPGKGGTYVRAAGTGGLTISRDSNGYVTLKMPSGELKKFSENCTATIGIVSNLQNYSNKLRKAGQNRHRGKRPIVRGVAMNPVDHPHGGGEGKSGPGRPSVSFAGISTKGKKTRKNKKSSFTIVRRKHDN